MLDLRYIYMDIDIDIDIICMTLYTYIYTQQNVLGGLFGNEVWPRIYGHLKKKTEENDNSSTDRLSGKSSHLPSGKLT